MSLLLVEGYDYPSSLSLAPSDTTLQLSLKRVWDSFASAGSNPSFGRASGRVSGGAFQWGSDGGNAMLHQRDFGSVQGTTIFVQCSYQCQNVNYHQNASIWHFKDNAGTLIGGLYFTGTQFRYVNGSGTQVAIGTGPALSLNTWYHVEVKVLFSATVGTVEIRVDGVVYCAITGINTVGGALATGMRSFCCGDVGGAVGANFNYRFIDHLLVYNTSGSAPWNDWVGERRIVQLIPNAAGTYSEWTPLSSTNVSNVDNAQYQTATYNLTAVVNNRDTYNLTNLPANTVSVDAIQALAQVMKDDVGSSTVQLLLRSAATDQLIGSPVSVASDYSTKIRAILEQDPIALAAWTVSVINALEAGVKRIS